MFLFIYLLFIRYFYNKLTLKKEEEEEEEEE